MYVPIKMYKIYLHMVLLLKCDVKNKYLLHDY